MYCDFQSFYSFNHFINEHGECTQKYKQVQKYINKTNKYKTQCTHYLGNLNIAQVQVYDLDDLQPLPDEF